MWLHQGGVALKEFPCKEDILQSKESRVAAGVCGLGRKLGGGWKGKEGKRGLRAWGSHGGEGQSSMEKEGFSRHWVGWTELLAFMYMRNIIIIIDYVYCIIIKVVLWGWSWSSVAERLPGMHLALRLIYGKEGWKCFWGYNFPLWTETHNGDCHNRASSPLLPVPKDRSVPKDLESNPFLSLFTELCLVSLVR